MTKRLSLPARPVDSSRAAPRLQWLDALRGLAALLVLVSHIMYRVGGSWPLLLDQYVQIGHVGVVLFLLTSGYLIPGTLLRAGSLRVFWIKRIFRLYPLYWCSLALALAWYALGLFPEAGNGDGLQAALALRTAPLAPILANATMLQTFLQQPQLSGVYWTLTLEMAFYLFVSLAFALGVLRYTVPLAVGCLAATVLVEGLLPRAGWQIAQPIASSLALMLTGSVVAEAHAGRVPYHHAWIIVLAALALLVLPLPANPHFWLPVGPSWLPARPLAFALFGLGLLIAHRPVPRPLIWLGTVSYSVYLLHVFLLPFALPWWGYLVGTYAVAAAAERWIERPGIAAGRWVLANALHHKLRRVVGRRDDIDRRPDLVTDEHLHVVVDA